MDKYIKADDLLDAIYPLDPENDGSDGCTDVAVSLTLTSEELEEMMTALLCAVLAGALILVCLARLWAQQRRHKRKE